MTSNWSALQEPSEHCDQRSGRFSICYVQCLPCDTLAKVRALYKSQRHCLQSMSLFLLPHEILLHRAWSFAASQSTYRVISLISPSPIATCETNRRRVDKITAGKGQSRYHCISDFRLDGLELRCRILHRRSCVSRWSFGYRLRSWRRHFYVEAS